MTTTNIGRFDPITLEVLWTRMISIVDEAAAALVRTSFSTVVRESHDFSCVITDASGRSLVQATDSIPSFIGTLPATIQHFLKEIPAEQLEPGDVIATNDIWQGTGHLPDISVAMPIFFEGKLVGFAGSTAHAPDIGGKIRSPEPREVFEEGFQIPIMKIVNAGKADETFLRLLRKNVRVPDQVVGDLWAQVTALELMDERVSTLMREYKLATLADLAAEIRERSERAMRAAIRELPDGVYESALKTDGLTVPLDLKVKLTIAGDEVHADFTGSSPQVDKAINCALCYTYAMTAYAVKCAAAPNLPNNDGRDRADHGERARGHDRQPGLPGGRRLARADRPLRADAAVRRAGPGGARTRDRRHGQPALVHQPVGRARGRAALRRHVLLQRRHGRHGVEGRRELPELAQQHLLGADRGDGAARAHARALPPHAPGLGGAGQVPRRARPGHPDREPGRGHERASFLAERTKSPAPGIAGGADGEMRRARDQRQAGRPEEPAHAGKGDKILLRTPGGGGYGKAEERDPALVAKDKVRGYVG